MPSTFYYFRISPSAVDKVARTFPKTLPSIKTPVRIKTAQLKHPDVKTSEGRLLTIGKHLTKLFREERIEMIDHRAHAVRPYAERLLQLAIEYGDCHKPTMEVCNFYLHEKDLIHKLFKVFVPRYRNCSTAFTTIHQLPAFYGADPDYPYELMQYCHYNPVILEMKGNPYPPVVRKPEVHQNSLLNVLLSAAQKNYAMEKKQKLIDGVVTARSKTEFVHITNTDNQNADSSG